MDDFKIYIPSFGRAGQVLTHKMIPYSTIVVPRSQLDAYTKYYGDKNCMAIPDSRDGRIAKKRNAILDLTPEKNIVMMDDDILKIYWIENKIRISEEEFLDILSLGFELCLEYKTGLFGFNWNSNPVHLLNSRPITTNKVFFNTYGIIKTDLRFDEKLIRTEDADFWVQYTMKYKSTIRFNHIKTEYKIKTAKQAGGIKEKVESRADTSYLKKKWRAGIINLDRNHQMKITQSPFKDLI